MDGEEEEEEWDEWKFIIFIICPEQEVVSSPQDIINNDTSMQWHDTKSLQRLRLL